ncbi:MAG: ATP-binding protein [Desulfobacula sp.]|nr:ATP-binding protein [Desulfobacula sp.]
MKKISLSTGIPPLIIIGTIIVLFPIFTYMTIDRISRQKTQSIRLLIEKSTALIRAFEAGTYSGMMNMGWNQDTMKNLLKETAALPDIAYLFIANKKGIILVHNQEEMIGKSVNQNIDLNTVIQSDQLKWKIIKREDDKDVFEVYKKFSPVNQNSKSTPDNMMNMHMQMQGMAFQNIETYEDTVIFVGLDMALITQADKGDTRHTILMTAILALIGFTGFVLVYIVQNYTAARSSLSRIQIFSDNLVENMPMGLIVTDMNNQVVSVNPAAKKILNIQAQFHAKDIYTLLPEQLKKVLISSGTGTRLIEKEIHIDRAEHQSIQIEVIASPLSDKEDNSLGVLMIIRDKTELNRLKNEMEQNKRLAAIGRLAAGVAHEIRNPLSSLKGYATFFKEIFDADSQNHTIADVMIKEVDRLNRVVSELVELAKPVAISRNPVDLGELILENAQQIAYEPDAQKIDIRTNIDPDLPAIHADADRLKQVLLNLCLNSIQAMDGSGTLGVTLTKAPSSEKIIICISDTGTGIKKEDIPSIFEPYFTTKLSGTGIGLAIVHNIVKAHQGKIEVKSKLTKGTVFTITLPIKIR